MHTPQDPASQSREASSISARKGDHLRMMLADAALGDANAGWDDVLLPHMAVPEVDFHAIDLGTELLGRRLRQPLLISGMTGGHPDAGAINAVLARAAERHGMAMGVGSQRAHLAAPALAETFRIARDEAPTAFLIANVGAPNLIDQDDHVALTTDDVRRAVDLIRADALAVHLNFLQEAVQPEGQTRARGVLAAIGRLAATIEVPIIAKETGAGITARAARLLIEAGIRAIDVGGAGGTSFAVVEAGRARERGDDVLARLGESFAGWGVPTAACVASCRALDVPIIASGGLRTGIDAAKAFALGADAVAMARPLLVAASQGDDALDRFLAGFLRELRTAVFLAGCANLRDVRALRPSVTGRTRDWLAAERPG